LADRNLREPSDVGGAARSRYPVVTTGFGRPSTDVSHQEKLSPTYRCHNPTGQAVLTIDGQDFYLGPFGSTQSKKKYNRLIDAWNTRQERSSTEVEELPQLAEVQHLTARLRLGIEPFVKKAANADHYPAMLTIAARHGFLPQFAANQPASHAVLGQGRQFRRRQRRALDSHRHSSGPPYQGQWVRV
jgi:hypothetical protein